MPSPRKRSPTKKRQETEIDWSRLHREAQRRFGVKQFRPGQREIIEAVVQARDVIGVMPTGGGKSLTFQLPTLLVPGRPAIVVMPLISLMQDQHEKAEEANIPAAKLNSTLTAREERETAEEIEEGSHEIIYVTPERLENPEYMDTLKRSGVWLFVVDEAHCVSQWGHDFRPAYLNLREAARQLGRPPILALTATATPRVIEDVVDQLDMRNPAVVNTGIERENLFFEVFRTVNTEAKHQRIRQVLREAEGVGIVYTATVRTANELCTWLKDEGIRVERYHGKVKARDRERIQQDFMNNAFDVIVATKAFGLGIDKSDIRFVLHYSFPDSLESYYQEAGRAGRDGKPARAILLYRLEDRRVQGFFLGGKYPRREHSLKVYETINQMLAEERFHHGVTMRDLVTAAGLPERKVKVVVAQLESAGIVGRKNRKLLKVRDFDSAEEFDEFLSAYEKRGLSDRERLDAMMRYAETTDCRMRSLRQYFGEEPGEECGHCDNCRSGASKNVDEAHATTQQTQSPINPVAPDAPPPPAFLESAKQPTTLFSLGEPVIHKKFGTGEVVEISGSNVTARFEKVGTRRVRAEFLRKAA